MKFPSLLPSGLARRFALASAALAAVALLLIFLASWWVITRQHEAAVAEIDAREQRFRASAVEVDLEALHARMTEMAASTILATGLVDSAGKETYLQPFLGGVRQINGVPVQVAFTDFEGKEIASNPGAAFSPAQVDWLRQRIEPGRPAATIFGEGEAAELVAIQPLVYTRTASPEGALLYKVRLAHLHTTAETPLEWKGAPPRGEGVATPVKVPEVFAPLEFRVRNVAPVASTRVGLARQAFPLLVIALVLFTAVVLVGGRVAAVLTRDLRQLEGFSRTVVGHGLTHERAAETGSEEVRSLAASLNQMLDKLQDQHDALVDEGRKLGELAAALRAANRRKDEFLAMLAHELRNPLAPIATGAQLLRSGQADPRRLAQTAEIISRQAQHMSKLVDDLLDVSRVTRGLISLERKPVDLRDIVAAAVDQTMPLMQSRRHTLRVDKSPQPAWVEGDAARLIQVVSNLLNNAGKYTPDGGEVHASVQVAGEHVTLEVADNGIGIPAELMPEIFDLFTQGTRPVDRSQGGLGLGLALVKNLVELHGGSVQVHSAGPDQGSTFTVILPRGSAPAPSSERREPAADGASPPRLRVLVVDDNVDAAQTLAAFLELEGHEVQTAHDAAAALRHAKARPVDVFVLDIGLPDMDGNKLARTLRGFDETRDSVLVALTGYGQPADRAASRDAGFDHHLVKPVDLPELLSVLGTRVTDAA